MPKAKTPQLLTYVIKTLPGASVTSLMKLSYIIDLVAVQNDNKKISDFEYVRYNYGPFDKKIYKYLEGLLTEGVIKEGANISSSGEEFVTYIFNKTKKVALDKISDTDKSVIDAALEALEGYGPKALTELTYRTKPMKKIGATLNNRAGLNKHLDLTA